MKTIFIKALQFTLLGLLFACAPLEEAEEIIKQEPLKIIVNGKDVQVNSKGLEGPFDKGKCGCTFTSEVSANLIGKNWITIFTLTANGAFSSWVTQGSSTTENPRSFFLGDVLKNQTVEITHLMNYDDPVPFNEQGWIKTKIACEKAPPVTYSAKIPPFNNTGGVPVHVLKFAKITFECGTEDALENLPD
ncbi:MAG: hypothetical protein R8P61_37575 [Bacteroidia bacterium]|nr:hypothetical protein [Bacteroidia bacterium]